jgi:hypothetical protein
MPKHVTQPTAISFNGEAVVILPDDIYADNHPWVRARPDLFVDAFDESRVIAAPPRSKHAVEQATAAPGEKRG